MEDFATMDDLGVGAPALQSSAEENGSADHGNGNGVTSDVEDVALEQNGKVGHEDVADDEKQLDVVTLKLKLALKEIINKDNLVKQHAKVAEEAISGWEKAEAEAALFKQQLDTALQQKVTLEERVGHLDGALKECVKQLRSGREEQEQKQEEHLKKAKEWDTLRSELEAKLAEANLQIAATASASESLQQRLSGLSETQTQAVTEAKRFSVKMEAVEKENSNLRHDVRTLKKELVALNGESKKAVEMVKMQNSEYVKKVAKLEAECQKVKGLLRKKSAASQARNEDIPDRRKSLGRMTSSPRAPSMESFDDISEISNREMADEKFALEDEARNLKQVLEKRNKELQAARFLCARTASKLEERLETLQDTSTLASLNGHLETLRAFGSNQPSIASQGSCNGDEADDLGQVKKGRDGKKPDKLLDTTSFELMDDFLEMEKLTSNLPHENGHMWENANREGSPDSNCSENAREKELNEMCKALNKKVAELESRLASQAEAKAEFKDLAPSISEFKDLAPSISEVILAMEAIAKGSGAEYDEVQANGSCQDEVLRCGLVWSSPELNSAFKKVVSVGNGLLERRGDAVRGFVVELGAVLKVLGDLCSRSRTSDSETIKGLEDAKVILEKDIAALERQLVDAKVISAETRETVDALKAEKKILEAALHEKNLRMAEALEVLKAEKMALEHRLEDASRTVSEKESQLSTFISKRDVEKQDIESRISTAETEAEQLRAELDKVALLEAEVAGVKLDKEAAVLRLTEEVNRSTTRSSDAEAAVQRLTEDLSRIRGEMEADLVASNQELAKARSQLAVVVTENEALERRLNSVEDVVMVREEELQLIQAEMERVASEKEKLAVELDRQLEKTAKLEEELSLEKAAAQDSLSAVNVDVEKMVIESAELKYEKQKLEKALALAKEQLQEEAATLRAHIEKLEEDLKNLAMERDERCQKVEEVTSELERLAEEIHKAGNEKIAAERALNLTIDALKAESAQLEEVKGELSMKLRATEEKLKVQEANFISLQEEFYQMKIEKEEMEQSLAMADQNLQLSHGRIAALMDEHTKFKCETSSSYEQARGDFEKSDRELKLVSEEKEKLGGEMSELRSFVEKLEAELSALKEDGESKLEAAAEQIKQLEAKCSRLEGEKVDLEEVLASTNEMAQTVKAEFNSLSSLAEELGVLKAEKMDLEQLLTAAEESIEAVTAEMKKLEAEKAEVEHDLALAQVTWKSQLFEANELVAAVRAELALAIKSKQLVEDELAQGFAAKAELQYQAKAAEHEANQLKERARTLEVEVEQEREATKNAQAELDNFKDQLSTRPEFIGSETADSSLGSAGHEVFAAKLDECHRAILSLGQQLHSFTTTSRSSPSMTEPAMSEESIGTLQVVKDDSGDGNEESQSKEMAGSEAAESADGKIFVPTIPLEGRPRSKSTSTSPGKPKQSSRATAANSELSKSFDMGSPSDKPSSSGFSRFFRSKGSSHHHG